MERLIQAAKAVALVALFAVGGLSHGAVLVPVIPDETGELFMPGMAANVGTTMLIDGSQSAQGQQELWELGEYRVAIENTNAAITAAIDSQRVQIDTFASLRDTSPGNFSGPESNPEIRDLWFHIGPSGNDNLGDRIDFYLSLSQEAASTNGLRPQSQARAILSNAETPDVSPLLFRPEDSAVAEVVVGEMYKLSLTHANFVTDGLLVSSARLHAGLVPGTASAPDPVLAGDYNLDGVVNAADYTVWRDGTSKPYDFDLDGDGNGVIDEGDREILNTWYGSTLPGGNSLAIPEPATALLLGLGVLLLGRSSR